MRAGGTARGPAWDPHAVSGYGTARMPTGLGAAPGQPWQAGFGISQTGCGSGPGLGSPSAVALSFLLCVWMSQSSSGCPQRHPSPTQPAASPGYRTDLPDLLTVINNGPSDGVMSRGVFPQAHVLEQRDVLPTPFPMSVSKGGSALCPGLHPAAPPAPRICLAAQPTRSAWECCNIS